MRQLKIGFILPNGSKVIHHNTEYNRVLAFKEEALHPYISWTIDKDLNCYYGQYYINFNDALLSYCKET